MGIEHQDLAALDLICRDLLDGLDDDHGSSRYNDRIVGTVHALIDCIAAVEELVRLVKRLYDGDLSEAGFAGCVAMLASTNPLLSEGSSEVRRIAQ